MSRRLTSIVVALAACHHSKVHKPGDEWLKSVQFEGNHGLKDAALLDGLALHRTLTAERAPDPYTVQVDADRLRGQYARLGYFETNVQARVERNQDAATIVYSIEEGSRAKTHAEIFGLPDDPALAVAKVRAKLPLAEGAPFDYAIYDAAKLELLRVVQDAGYAHAKLDASVEADLATHVATIELAYSPGPKCTFGTITIQGVDGDLRDAIENRLAFQTGQTYSTTAITKTQRALYGLGRFSTVQVQPENESSGTSAANVVNVKVAVSESAPRQVTLGGGFGMDPISYEIRGRAGYQIAGWPTPLDTLTLDFRPAYAYLRDGSGYEPRMRALARLERQDLFVTYAVGSVEVGYDYLAYEAFTQYGPRAQLGYEAQLGTHRLRVRAGYLIHRYDFRNPSVLIDPSLRMQIGIDRPELVGAYQQAFIADYRDHPVEPRLGVYGELKVTEGTRYAGGSYTFEEVVPEVRGYVPAGPVVFAARGRYGAIYGEVPPTERLFSGGSTSQRGFGERQLSPSVTGPVNGSTITVPYGGAGMIDGGVEARFPLTHVRKMPLGGVVFLDGGDVTETPSQLNLSRLAWAAGFGLRLHTIVGPVRADIGYRLNRTGPDDPEPNSRYAFHFSLGEAF